MKKSFIILGLSLVLFVSGIYLSSQLTIKSNMEDMLPSDSQVLQASEDFNQYFEAQEMAYIFITYKNQDMNQTSFKDKATIYMKELSQKLDESSFVVANLYRIDQDAFEPYYWAYLDIEVLRGLEQNLINQNYENLQGQLEGLSALQNDVERYEYLMNDAGTHYMMMIQPFLDNDDFEVTRNNFYKGMMAVMRDLSENPKYADIEVGLTGGAFIQDLEADTIAFSGLGNTLILTLMAILAVVVLFFGQLKLPALTIYPLVLGAVMASAAAYIVFGSINMFSVSFALLLLGLGIDFAVHFLTRYQSIRSTHETKARSIQIALKSTGISIIIGALTTAFAFFTFGFAKFKAFEQMGVISGIGILLLCVSMLVLVPNLLNIFDRSQYRQPKFELEFRGLKWFHLICTKWLLPLVIILIVGIGLLMPVVKDTRINGDVSSIYPEDIPSRINAIKIEEAFDINTNTISVYLDDEEQLVDAISQLESRTDVDFTRSIMDYLPQNQEEKKEILNKILPILSNLELPLLDNLKLTLMTYDQLPKDIRDNYVGKSNKLRLDIVPLVDLYEEDACNTIIEAVYEISGNYPVGMPIVMNEVTVLVKSDMLFISTICMLVVLIFGMVAFRSIPYGLLTILPISVTLYFVLALAPTFGIDLNLFSVAALPLIIGIGIDSGIHLLHRLIEEGVEGISIAVQSTGKAILLTTVTTMIGFGSLATVNHPGMKSFGLIVVLGMALNVVFTLMIIPSGYSFLIKKFNRLSKKRLKAHKENIMEN